MDICKYKAICSFMIVKLLGKGEGEGEEGGGGLDSLQI